jgi:hypothetical protein
MTPREFDDVHHVGQFGAYVRIAVGIRMHPANKEVVVYAGSTAVTANTVVVAIHATMSPSRD